VLIEMYQHLLIRPTKCTHFNVIIFNVQNSNIFQASLVHHQGVFLTSLQGLTLVWSEA